MSGFQTVIAQGNLGADPEIRYTQNGTAVANFRLAVSEQWTDKNSNEKKERTEWLSCVVWGKRAEVINQYLSKGSGVLVHGKLQTRKWQDKDGRDQYKTEINVSDFTFTGGGKNSNASEGKAKSAPKTLEPPQFDFNDDLPF